MGLAAFPTLCTESTPKCAVTLRFRTSTPVRSSPVNTRWHWLRGGGAPEARDDTVLATGAGRPSKSHSCRSYSFAVDGAYGKHTVVSTSDVFCQDGRNTRQLRDRRLHYFWGGRRGEGFEREQNISSKSKSSGRVPKRRNKRATHAKS